VAVYFTLKAAATYTNERQTRDLISYTLKRETMI